MAGRGAFAQAAIDWSEAVRLDPKYAGAFADRALAYGKLGQAGKARADTETALRLDPDVSMPRPTELERPRTDLDSRLAPNGDTGVLSERRVALVIGNSAYATAGALPNPARDAQAVVEALRGAGFKSVTVATDLGRSQFPEALEAFAAQAERRTGPSSISQDTASNRTARTS